MVKIEGEVFCDNCGVQIFWSPVISVHRDAHTGQITRREYCCQDCLEKRPCRCGERMELDEERRRSGSLYTSEIGGLG